jgi:chemotaxis protein CheC
LEHSAVCEVGNIVAGAFLTALCEMTGLDTACEPPGLAWDMVGSILESLSCVVPSLGDLAVTIVTETHLGDVAVEGVFALIPELQSLDPLFSALGVANAAAA